MSTPANESGDHDPYTDVGAKFGRLQLPKLDTNAIDLSSVAPIYGVQGGAGYEPDYLDYNIKGRDLMEKVTYNAGMCYLAGIMSGGGYGVLEGARTAPSSRARIRINAILNAAGKRGSRLGNAMAVLAMFYTTWETVFDRIEADKYLGNQEWVNPVLAATATGLVFKGTAKASTMGLAGVVGGLGMGAFYAGSNALSRVFGSRR